MIAAMANAVTHQQHLESPGPILADLITSSPDSKSSSSSCEDSRPPSSFQCNRSVAYMSPGGALGGGIPSVDECGSARRLRRESLEKTMDLSKEKEQMSAQMKVGKILDQYFGGLKTLDTFGNCQRPVFSLGVSQYMHKITNL